MMIRKGLKTVTQISHLTLLSRRAAGGWGYIFAPPPPFFLSLNPSPTLRLSQSLETKLKSRKRKSGWQFRWSCFFSGVYFIANLPTQKLLAHLLGEEKD